MSGLPWMLGLLGMLAMGEDMMDIWSVRSLARSKWNGGRWKRTGIARRRVVPLHIVVVVGGAVGVCTDAHDRL